MLDDEAFAARQEGKSLSTFGRVAVLTQLARMAVGGCR